MIYFDRLSLRSSPLKKSAYCVMQKTMLIIIMIFLYLSAIYKKIFAGRIDACL